MAWYGHAPTSAQIEAEAKRKEADKLNAANRKRKEELASGYNVAISWPRH